MDQAPDSRPRPARPTPAELRAAAGTALPDLVSPGLNILFAGINPSLYSAATGHHFARPGNRFWPALHLSGFTKRRLDPCEQRELLGLGIGITNIAARSTARADELTSAELMQGRQVLAAKVLSLRPLWLGVVGVTAYRTAFGEPRAQVGLQDTSVGETRVWVLPNPSGLNAHWNLTSLAEEFGRLRNAIFSDMPDRSRLPVVTGQESLAGACAGWSVRFRGHRCV